MKTFGDFLKNKRLEKGINLRKLADLLNVAPAYMSDIENGKRNSPSNDKMIKLIEVFQLNEQETNEMYDLAAQDRANTVAPDISEYVMANDTVRVALRKAKDLKLGEQDWLEIIRKMENGDGNK